MSFGWRFYFFGMCTCVSAWVVFGGGYQVSLQLVPLLMAERIGLGLGETTAADFAVGETAGQRRERQRLSQAGAKRPTPAPHAHRQTLLNKQL
jgi:hypothetical protein